MYLHIHELGAMAGIGSDPSYKPGGSSASSGVDITAQLGLMRIYVYKM